MSDAASKDTGYRFDWALWALGTLTSLSFAPGAWVVTHHVYHRLESYGPVLSPLTHASIWVGSHLGLVALLLAAGSGAVLIKHRRAGYFAICAQLLLFLAVSGLTAAGMLGPFESMCAHPDGLKL
jgi:hypothetical protein